MINYENLNKLIPEIELFKDKECVVTMKYKNSANFLYFNQIWKPIEMLSAIYVKTMLFPKESEVNLSVNSLHATINFLEEAGFSVLLVKDKLIIKPEFLKNNLKILDDDPIKSFI